MPWLNYRSRFLLKNLAKGLAILVGIVLAYVLLQKYTDLDGFLDTIGQWPVLVFSVFVVSEVVFGIIPPELFMIWSLNNPALGTYILDVALLAGISFGAGVFGYFIGSYLQKQWPEFFKKNILRYKNTLNRFGGLLIFVGAVTPIPFSAVCMLVGSTKYNFPRFLLIASARFLRFAVYGFIIYQANI